MVVLAGFLAIFIGIAVGLLGGGGSILTTPLLVYVMGFDPKQAIAASLFVVAVTSAFGLIHYARTGRVRWRTGLIFGGAGMAGAFIGGQIGSHLPGGLLMGAFAVMMGVTAVAMIRGRKTVNTGKAHTGLPLFRIILDGAIVGFITGIVGAGGGFLVVPALVLLGGIPMSAAVGTSLLVVMMKSTAGFIGYAVKFGGGSVMSWNPETKIDWSVTLLVTAMAVIGSFIGAFLSGKIHPDKLRKGFGWFVFVMAIFVLSQQIGKAILDYARGSALQMGEVIVGAVVLIVLFIVAIRWPAKLEVADYDLTGAEGTHLADSEPSK